MEEVRQDYGIVPDINNVVYTYPEYGRLAIGTYNTDKFKFSITKPTDSNEELYYIDYGSINPLNSWLRAMFNDQVGIGPTLNLDWIWNNGGTLISNSYMFDGCKNLEEISMPNYKPSGIREEVDTDFYKYTFRNCHKLKKIECGPYLYACEGFKEHFPYLIGTFENCYSLKYINFSHVDANAHFSVPESSTEPTDTIFKNCNSLQAIFIGNWDKLNSDDRATITDKFKNLLQLSGINPDTIYIGKYDLTVIH